VIIYFTSNQKKRQYETAIIAIKYYLMFAKDRSKSVKYPGLVLDNTGQLRQLSWVNRKINDRQKTAAGRNNQWM